MGIHMASWRTKLSTNELEVSSIKLKRQKVKNQLNKTQVKYLKREKNIGIKRNLTKRYKEMKK